MVKKNPIQVRCLDHVVVISSDIIKSLEFYCGILGLLEERRLDSYGLIQLRAGSSIVDIIDRKGSLGQSSVQSIGERKNIDHFALELEAFDEQEMRDYLEENGVTVGEVAVRYGARGFGSSLYINDPDGNVVELKGPPVSEAL